MKRVAAVPGIALALFLLIISLAALYARPVPAHSQGAGTAIKGYFWSDTIGWISLSCSTDPSGCGSGSWGLSIDSSGNITGYAWSDNLGWISANPSDLTGCPSGPCTATIGPTGTVSGWLRALTGGTAQSGGWDGFISLGGSGYGLTESNGSFSGYAWGDQNVGWLDSEYASTLYNTCTASVVYGCSNSQTIVSTSTSSSCAQTVSYTSCTAPQFCSSGSSICLSPSITFISSGGHTGDLQVIPSVVHPGNTVQVFWDATDTASCAVAGSNGDGTASSTDTNSPGLWNTISGANTSSPINAQMTYTLSCTGYSGANPPSVTQTVQVDTTPTYKEI